jgi:hypothetical protein
VSISRRVSFINKCLGLLQTLLIQWNRAGVRALKAQALRRNPRVQLMITPLLLNTWVVQRTIFLFQAPRVQNDCPDYGSGPHRRRLHQEETYGPTLGRVYYLV